MDSTDIHVLPDPAEGSQVYFIQPAGGGLVKIGVASDLRRRLRNLQHMSPVRLNLLAVMPGDKAWEEQLHYTFGDLREYGEWFQPGSELLAFIATLEQQPIELEDLPKPPLPKKRSHSEESRLMAASVPLLSTCEDCGVCIPRGEKHCNECVFCADCGCTLNEMEGRTCGDCTAAARYAAGKCISCGKRPYLADDICCANCLEK